MFYSTLTADNTGRYLNGRLGRDGWIWNTKGKSACLKCQIHRVRGGGSCPVCGFPLVWVSIMPRKQHKAAWKAIYLAFVPKQVFETWYEYQERRKQNFRPHQNGWGRLMLRDRRPGEATSIPNPRTWVGA